MKLLGYEVITGQTLLTESENGKPKYYMEGIFAQAEKRNRNGRIYPKAVLEKAIDDYGVNYVANGRALGELNHPDTAAINPDRACILIKKLEWEGNNVLGKALVLEDLPCGKIVKGLMEAGTTIGVSTRGAGSLQTEADGDVVSDDFQVFRY